MLGWAARLVIAASLLAVASMAGFLSLANWNAAVASFPLASLAGRIERRQPVSLAAVEDTLPAVSALADGGACNDAANRAALTIASVAQQARNQAQSFDDWSEGLARTSRVLRRGLACTPTNGNFWGRLAITERVAAPTAARVERYLLLSQRFAPSEAGSLMARAEVWRTSPWLKDTAGAARSRDIRVILEKARVADALRMLRQADPSVMDDVRTELATVRPAQAAELQRMGLLSPRQAPKEYAPPRDIFDSIFLRSSGETPREFP